MDWRAPLLRRSVFARQLRQVFSVIRSVHVFALVCLVSACTPRMTPIPESSPQDHVSLVQVMYDDRISKEAKKAASRMGITGRLMYAISRELQRRERWSTDAGTRLTIRLVDFAMRPRTSARVGMSFAANDRLAGEVVVEHDGDFIKTYPVETPSTSGHGVGEGYETRLTRLIETLAITIVEGY